MSCVQPPMSFTGSAIAWIFFASLGLEILAEEWPMRGRDGSRNAVSTETNPPVFWSVEHLDRERVLTRNRGVRWSAALGTETFSSPVISQGLVWIGTNHLEPVSKKTQSALKCFRESDGELLYEYISPPLAERRYDAGWSGLGSSPLIEGERLWVVTNRSEVLCWDIGPLIRGEKAPKQLWKQDLVETFDTYPRVPLMGPPRSCSIGASWQGRIFVTINHGLSNNEKSVANPLAPSLVCLNQKDGSVLWQDHSPGENIHSTQFASPTLAIIEGIPQVIVPQSDGWVRAFAPSNGEILWEFDINDKESKLDFNGTGRGSRNTLLAEAVIYKERVYVASGQEPELGEGKGRLVCIDPTRRGDISTQLAVDASGQLLPRRRIQAVIASQGERSIANPNSGLIWEFTQDSRDDADFSNTMHRSITSVVIKNDLLIATDLAGLLHCLDADTGARHWHYDTFASIYATPLIVDDKIYVADEDGEVAILHLSSDPSSAEPLHCVDHPKHILAGLAYVNGTLYVPTRDMLYAIDASEAKRRSAALGHWPQWRGPLRDNRSSDTGLLQQWPEDGPPMVWQVDGLGDGIASLAVANGRIFTSTVYGNAEYAIALDEETGERLWATEIGPALPEHPLMRWFSQRCPTVDGTHVFFFTQSGWLMCLDTITGWIQWRVSYPHEFGSRQGKWGFCDRPLIDGNKLIALPGGTKATLAAIDKSTGNVLWTSLTENRVPAGYGSTVRIETDGLPQYVAVLDDGIAGFAADDGRFLWKYEKISNKIVNSFTPMACDSDLLCVNGYRAGIARLGLHRSGNAVRCDEIFFVQETVAPFADCAFLLDESLFAFRTRGRLGCFDMHTGGQRWTEDSLIRGQAAATYADGHVYVFGSDGTVAMMEVDSDRFVHKAQFSLPLPSKSLGVTQPVVTGGHLYLRDNNRLFKFDVAADRHGREAIDLQTISLAPPKVSNRPALSFDPRRPNAIFVPTPADVVNEMLRIGELKPSDVLFDLGSGDGRILIAAASQRGCRAVGIEMDKDLVALSTEKIRNANVHQLAKVIEGDVYQVDFSPATVVTAYLPSEMLKQLAPKFQLLKEGTRIVTHQFLIPGYVPDQTYTHPSEETGADHSVYLWTVPFRPSNAEE